MSPPTVDAPINPYPGLRPFREEEEYLFFGRERQVDVMVNTLAEAHFLAVVGTSGSGKSSLVNCGLRPALHRGLMASAGTAWRMAQFRPGSNPLRAMAAALARDGVLYKGFDAGDFSLADIIETTLRMSTLGLIDVYRQARLDEGVHLLLLVDQFEELFRYRRLGASHLEAASGIGEDATGFVNRLLEVRADASCPVYVVLTMRSDFLGECAQFFGLPEAINKGQYLVPRMSRDERRAAIVGPASVGGAEIAPVLLTRLVNDVGDNPDQLSILQHALNRTWARWQQETGGKGPLELRHYEAIGTMVNALDEHAEEAYSQLAGERDQKICEKIFKALTDTGTDARGIRRPTTLDALCAIAEATAAQVTAVVNVFREPSRSFLMPPAGEPLKAETVIDISHESLMRVWRRLRGWGDAEAHSAQMYRRLAETAELHAAGKASLWRDPDLQVALDWRERNQPNDTWADQYHPDFGRAMRFLEESTAVRERDRRAEEERLRAEQERRERDIRRRSVRKTLALVVAVAVLGVLGTLGISVARREFIRHALMSDLGWIRISAPPGGQFMMGCVPGDKDCFSNERPPDKIRRPTQLSRGFEVMSREVTVDRFRRFVDAQSTIIGRLLQPRGVVMEQQPEWSQDSHPVVYVSWDDARGFCEFVRGRLPTEAEWEYAARGGNAEGIYPWGNKYSADQANGEGVAGKDTWEATAPVGSFPPNGYGLYDMIGNVWEWTSSLYRDNPFQSDGGSEDRSSRRPRAVRGGSWNDDAQVLRVSFRNNLSSADRGLNLGFRCARDDSRTP
jgi:formylglycine-generating enzyme required for sulfatase activity/energy-coupling factor transporter ATP-binding protein EcfA2